MQPAKQGGPTLGPAGQPANRRLPSGLPRMALEACQRPQALHVPTAYVSHKPFIVKVDGKSGLHSFKNFIVIELSFNSS